MINKKAVATRDTRDKKIGLEVTGGQPWEFAVVLGEL